MNMNPITGKFLIVTGIILIIAGLFFIYGKGIPLFKLPGDIRIEKENFSFYLPITTSVLISLLISLILFLAGKK